MSSKTPEPTPAELEILQILWDNGPSTVGFVNQKLNEERKVGYTTTLKIMQIMADKGLVQRDVSKRAHVYSSRDSADQTQRRLIANLMDRVFQGSASRLVMQALSTRKATDEELTEIRRLLDEMEGESP
jgi:BlaI family penicillinase repressor